MEEIMRFLKNGLAFGLSVPAPYQVRTKSACMDAEMTWGWCRTGRKNGTIWTARHMKAESNIPGIVCRIEEDFASL